MKSIIRGSSVIALLLFSSLVLTVPTLAKDFLHEVCIGFITLDSPTASKKIEKLVLVYDDHRSSGGDKRKITVSISRADTIYQGTNISDGSVTPLKIVNVDDPSDVLFDGTVEYLSGGVELVGKYFAAGDTNGVAIKTTLVGDEIPP
jgi:hypothetical protein